jgi:hypothetical protein
MKIINIENNLRLTLGFIDDLDKVKVLAATNDWDRRTVIMGGVKGKRQLQDLLTQAGIDHRHVRSGDVPVATQASPREIVKVLDDSFKRFEETQLKILRGEQLTSEEQDIRRPTSLHVFSSTTSVDDGLQRMKRWFEKHAQGN